ncbi:MAG: Asp-tRNA(Asn)/Glu-tRNA(Gln) amidotransferase subunit GatB [Chloroflexi bacterium]|nr:Asp-tRNA(Asn)/Glu-tRNA(Gln) amidotransferase subunit GatB [Chloroflexota bacterium]
MPAYEPVIGLEVHAELQTRSKMFCGCPVVDLTTAEPNTAVCEVCAGMPGTLPVINERAVEYALRVALALQCDIHRQSVFARKNYFYPDLPKGYQISQYELPLATQGRLVIRTSQGERAVRIRRVHLEEDTGKLTHVERNGERYSLVDLNRAGVPLLEIVSEPDMHSVEEVRAYATALRQLLRYLGVNSGDMQKGVIRFEANVSVRPVGSTALGTRVEIKNLNSFRALEESVAYEIQRQIRVLEQGGRIEQQTLGWDEARRQTVPQRSKEEAHDYRYFPEPDLPPLLIEDAWLDRVRQDLPEMPWARYRRFREQYGLSDYDANLLTAEKDVADFYEAVLAAAQHQVPAKMVANWVLGEVFRWLNQHGKRITELPFDAQALADLLRAIHRGEINKNTGQKVLAEMFETGQSPERIIEARGLRQISDADQIQAWVNEVLEAHPQEVAKYLAGKTSVINWLFGQVMRRARGRANPQAVRQALEDALRQRAEDAGNAS